jgi:hypothetical protein
MATQLRDTIGIRKKPKKPDRRCAHFERRPQVSHIDSTNSIDSINPTNPTNSINPE